MSRQFGNAGTIGDLSKLIDKAVSEFGPDCRWNGFDDETLTIQLPNGDWVFINNELEESSATESNGPVTTADYNPDQDR